MEEDFVASFPKIRVKLKEMIGGGGSMLFFNRFIFHSFLEVNIRSYRGSFESKIFSKNRNEINK